MQRLLAIYLRDQEAIGRAGSDLFRRALRNQGRHPRAAELRELAVEGGRDLTALHDLMRQLGVRSSPLLIAALRGGERLGRLKLNGSLFRRSPLSDLVEVQALLTLAHLKVAAWEAIAAADPETAGASVDVAALLHRANRQVERLVALHRQVAVEALSSPEEP